MPSLRFVLPFLGLSDVSSWFVIMSSQANGVGGVSEEDLSASVQETIKNLLASSLRKSLERGLTAAKTLDLDVDKVVYDMAGWTDCGVSGQF